MYQRINTYDTYRPKKDSQCRGYAPHHESKKWLSFWLDQNPIDA